MGIIGGLNSNLAWMRVGYGVRLVVGGILLWCVSEVRCGYILQEEIKSLQRSRKCSRCKQDHAIVHLCTVLYEQRSSHRDRPLPNPSSLFQMKYIKNGKKKSSLEQSVVVKKCNRKRSEQSSSPGSASQCYHLESQTVVVNKDLHFLHALHADLCFSIPSDFVT